MTVVVMVMAMMKMMIGKDDTADELGSTRSCCSLSLDVISSEQQKNELHAVVCYDF